MKFEKLNDSKIRIFFTQKDMDLNNISANNFLLDNNISQEILEVVICEAEKNLDFKTDDCKLLVEALSSAEEELIFTITKIDTYSNIHIDSPLIFKFENFDNFLNLCTYLKNMNFSIYQDYCMHFSLISYNKLYYLYIEDCSKIPLYILNVLDEFGEFVTYSFAIESLINEYGNSIFKQNAISEGIQMI